MSTQLSRRFSQSVALVEEFLRRHSAKTVALPAGEFPQGWAVEATIAGEPVSLEVLLPREFPSLPPRIRVTPAEQYFRQVPHVESDGLLCIYPAGVEFNTNGTEAGIELTWKRAIELLEAPKVEDFFDEFSSYWRLNTGSRREVLSLFAGETPVSAYALMSDRTIIAGATEIQLKEWWKNHKGDPKVIPSAVPIQRIDLDRSLYPKQFPETVADFIALLRSQNTTLAAKFFEQLARSTFPTLVILRIPSPKGYVEGALEIPALNLFARQDVQKGFRPGNVPTQIVQSRGGAVLRKTPLVRFSLQPITYSYIHSRGGNGTDLAQKSVAIVGCGSLGGYVAHLFAKAGVGRLTLIDPEILVWDNAGRHVLGVRFAGFSKAKSLAYVLRTEMPHLRVDAFAYSWREVHDFQSLVFSNCDLVVSTVGAWNAEHDLNLMLRKGDLSAGGLFTWIESHAVAGHALLVHPTRGGCMECVMDSWGVFSSRTCDSPAQVGIVGCAGSYQPYGVAEMIPTASLAVQLGIDYLVGRIGCSERRSWLGPKSLFDQHGLTARLPWVDFLANQPHGSIHHETLVPLKTCRCCH